MSFLFPEHRRSWRPRSCGHHPVSSIPPQCVYLVAYGGPVFGQRACGVRCRWRAGSRENMVAGACGGCNGCGRMGRRKAAAPCTQSVPQGKTACRIGTGPQRTGSLRSRICARMAAAKKACTPFGDTGKKQAGEGGGGESPLASTAEMRPDGGRRPCPLAGKTRHGIAGNDEGTLKISAVAVQARRASPAGCGIAFLPPKQDAPAVMPCGADRRAGQSP